MRRFAFRSAIQVCVLLVLALRVPAQDFAPRDQPAVAGWTVSIAPYFWAAGIRGDLAAFGTPEVKVDASFSDVWDVLDFGAMATGEARYDLYSIFADVLYTKLSGARGTPHGVVASSVAAGAETFAGLLGAGYSILSDKSGHLDFAAGLRLWSVDNDLSFTGGALDGRRESDGANWVDGLVGFRGAFGSYRAFLTGWGLVGAGGAALDWDLAVAPGFRFTNTFSLALGYRVLGIDYEQDGFVFDVRQHGPVLGVGLRF